jgi:type I restriction enzyme R subunit
MPPLTRYERANDVKKRNYFAKYGETARKVLESLLDKYTDEGIESIEPAANPTTFVDFLKIPPFSNIGTPIEIIKVFGNKEKYFKAIRELEKQIYSAA